MAGTSSSGFMFAYCFGVVADSPCHSLDEYIKEAHLWSSVYAYVPLM